MLKDLFTTENNILLSSSLFEAYTPKIFSENPPLSQMIIHMPIYFSLA
jgi:hypothetical protein